MSTQSTISCYNCGTIIPENADCMCETCWEANYGHNDEPVDAEYVEVEDDGRPRWNQYTETEVFGGPEEGGWTYTVGTPTGLSDFGPDRPQDTQFQYHGSYINDDAEDDGFRGEHIGNRKIWRKENHAPKAYPDEIPHYC